jgi:hypothetical protein
MWQSWMFLFLLERQHSAWRPPIMVIHQPMNPERGGSFGQDLKLRSWVHCSNLKVRFEVRAVARRPGPSVTASFVAGLWSWM